MKTLALTAIEIFAICIFSHRHAERTLEQPCFSRDAIAAPVEEEFAAKCVALFSKHKG